MTLKSPEMMRRVISTLADVVSIAKTARLLRMDASTIHVWQRASKRDADAKVEGSEWLVEIDGETKFFHEHCERTARAVINEIAANMFVRARDGTDVETRFQGQIVYKLSEDWLDEGMRDLLGLTDADKYARDANGRLIPVTQHEDPPVALVQWLMESHKRPLYGKQSKLDVNVKATVTTPPMIFGGPRQATIAAPLAMVEIIGDAEDDDAEPEVDLTVTSTDPNLPIMTAVDNEDFLIAPKPEEAPAPVIATAPEAKFMTEPLPDYSPTVAPILQSQRTGKPLSDLERDLLSKLPRSA